jgi:hypothetical protein
MTSRHLREYFAHAEELDLTRVTTLSYSIAAGDNSDPEDVAIELARVVTERLPSRLEYVSKNEGGVSVLDISHHDQWTRFSMAMSDIYWRPEDGLSSLLELAISMAEYDYASGIWLSNIEIPREYIEKLGGPKYSIAKLRQRLGNAEAPILAMAFGMLRPNRFAYYERHIIDALAGGIDILLQDMRMPLGRWRSKEEQFREIIKLRNIARDKARKDKLVLCTLSGTPYQMLSDADKFVRLGGDGFVVDAVTSGFGLLEDLRHFFPGAFITTTNMGSGLWSRPFDKFAVQRAGIDEVVISKLSRWAGADAVHAGTAGTNCYDTEWSPSITALSCDIKLPNRGFLEKSLRVAEGDLRQIAIWKNLQVLGNDSILTVPSQTLFKGDTRSIASSWREVSRVMSQIDNYKEALNSYMKISHKSRSVREELENGEIVK